jgi:hypothetical protein
MEPSCSPPTRRECDACVEEEARMASSSTTSIHKRDDLGLFGMWQSLASRQVDLGWVPVVNGVWGWE